MDVLYHDLNNFIIKVNNNIMLPHPYCGSFEVEKGGKNLKLECLSDLVESIEYFYGNQSIICKKKSIGII